MEVAGLKRDKATAEAGKWITDIPEMENLRLRVRGLRSPVVTALRSRKERAVPRKNKERDGSLKPDANLRVLGEVAAEVILLEWDGLTQDGKPLPYSKDLAMKWLTDPAYELFLDAVIWAAAVVDRESTDAQEESVGNSSKPSDGKSSGAIE